MFFLIFLIPILLVSVFPIALYVLNSLGMYSIAKRRGIHNYGLAWVPVANTWILGSIADQHDQLRTGKNSKFRWWLLILAVVQMVLAIVSAVLIVGTFVQLFAGAFDAVGLGSFSNWKEWENNVYYSQQLESYFTRFFENAGGTAFLTGLFAAIIPAIISGLLSLAYLIINYISLYKLYYSCNPQYATLFVVLSILFPVTMPFFVFCNREKDLGMPQAGAYYPPQPSYSQPVYAAPAQPYAAPATPYTAAPVQPQQTVVPPDNTQNP